MLKRGFDIAVALLLLVITLPVILTSALITTVSLRSWPFFTQDRVGRDGRPFKFVKLRTLPTHAPRYAGKYELADLRLPWVSRWLRHLHLDELPQLLLVVTGRMSLVGPRPEMPYLHEEMDDAVADARTSVRPGCTGLWQISEHCDAMIHEHPEFDAHYLRNQSLRFDLWILWRTVRLMLPVGQPSLATLHDLPAWARREPVPSHAPTSHPVAIDRVMQTIDA